MVKFGNDSTILDLAKMVQNLQNENAALRAGIEKAIQEIKFRHADNMNLDSSFYCEPKWSQVGELNPTIVELRRLLGEKG